MIDVSKCEFYNNNYCSCYRDNYGDCYHKCTDEELKYCYYKQLQQLKAENEKLKEQKEDYCYDCDVAERMRKLVWYVTDGRMSYANYTYEAMKQVYNEVLEEHIKSYREKTRKTEKCLNDIEKIINNFADKDIITLLDLSKEKNYKMIAEQYAKPIKQILQLIKEVKGNEKHR